MGLFAFIASLKDKCVGTFLGTFLFVELLNCPDEKKKSELLSWLIVLPDDLVPLQTCLSGVSRVGDRTGSGEVYQKILGFLNVKKKRNNNANTYDALIGEAAILNDLVLITNDQNLGEKVRELGGHVRDHLNFKGE